jgi:hypothetical protein
MKRLFILTYLALIAFPANAEIQALKNTDILWQKFGVFTIGDLSVGEEAPVSIGDVRFCVGNTGIVHLLGSTPVWYRPKNEGQLIVRLVENGAVELEIVPFESATKIETAVLLARRSHGRIRCSVIPSLYWDEIPIFAVKAIEGQKTLEDLFVHLEKESSN